MNTSKELPENWDKVKLKEIGEFQYGYTTSAINRNTGIKLLRITDIGEFGKLKWNDTPFCNIDKNEYIKYKLSTGDILFARIGASTGKTCIIASKVPDSIFASYLIRFKIKGKVHPNFLFFFTQTFDYWNLVNAGKDGKLKKGLNANQLKEFQIPLPPLDEQKMIAHVLSLVQEAKEKTDAVIAAAKELKKSMMKHLFTYGPVPPAEADKVKLKETEIGPIPEVWEVKKIIDIAKNEKGSIRMGPFGSQLKKTELSMTGTKVYGQENIIRKDFSLGDRFISDEKYEQLKGFKIEPLDVLVTMMGTIGHSIVFPENIEKGIIDSHLLKIKVDKRKMDPNFLSILFDTNYLKNFLFNQGHGVIMKGLNSTIIKNTLIPVPDLKVQERIIEIVNSLNYKIEVEEGKKRALEGVFKSLLNHLMTGKIRVNHLEIEE